MIINSSWRHRSNPLEQMKKENEIPSLKEAVELLMVRKSDVNRDVILKYRGRRQKVPNSVFSFPGNRSASTKVILPS